MNERPRDRIPRPTRYPIPLYDLWGDPRYVALPSAARGMLLSLCENFWKSACAPLPRDDDQLFSLARAHRPTWRLWREMVTLRQSAHKPLVAHGLISEGDAHSRDTLGTPLCRVAAGIEHLS
jgi:hypothetical protein